MNAQIKMMTITNCQARAASSLAPWILVSKIQINYIKVSVNPLGFVNCVEISSIKWTILLAALMSIRKICLLQDDNLKAEAPFEDNTVGEQRQKHPANMIKSLKVNNWEKTTLVNGL